MLALAALLVWFEAGCWEDAAGNYVLVNTTERENCQMVQSWKATSATQALTVQRRYMAGLPLNPDAQAKARRWHNYIAMEVR